MIRDTEEQMVPNAPMSAQQRHRLEAKTAKQRRKNEHSDGERKDQFEEPQASNDNGDSRTTG